MSQQQQQKPILQKQQKKSKQQLQKQKNNTQAWKKKQQEKRKKKQQQAANKQGQKDKGKQKALKKQQKKLLNQANKKQQNKVQTQDETKSLKQQNKQKLQKQQTKLVDSQKIKKQKPQAIKITQQKQPQVIKITQQKPRQYKQLQTLQKYMISLNHQRLDKNVQQRLIIKYLDQYITQNDTILVLSNKKDLGSLKPCTRVYIHHPSDIFNSYNNNINDYKNDNSITCTYQDIPLLYQSTITKIFIQLQVIFSNGYSLVHKGFDNLIIVANEYKIPIIGFTSSWNFNGWNCLSLDMFINKYGQILLEKYAIIEETSLEVLVLEIGSIIPKQIHGQISNLCKIYRGFDLDAIKW